MSMRLICGLLVLTTVRAIAQQPAPAHPAAKGEVHAVCIREGVKKTGDMIHGGKAAVQVDRPSKSVTLLVSAHESVTWEITATPGTKLTKVILGGGDRQAANVPKDVEVVEKFREKREEKQWLVGPFQIDSVQTRPFIRALSKLTGQELDSFQGKAQYDPTKPFIVKDAQIDERLSTEYPKVTPAKDLPKVTFQANYIAPLGRDGFAFSFGTFTHAGPDRDTLKPLPRRIFRVAYDPGAKQYYGIGLHEIHLVDLEKGRSEKLDLGLDVPKLSGPGPITFDTKRGRLLVPAHDGLYEYTVATKKWAVIAEFPRFSTMAGLAYHTKSDTLYGLGHSIAGAGKFQPMLYEMNHKGAIVKSTPLGAPIVPVAISSYGFSDKLQLIDAGDHLAALITTEHRDMSTGLDQDSESFLFLIDPKTGKLQLAWKE